jgi:hypothetical protein
MQHSSTIQISYDLLPTFSLFIEIKALFITVGTNTEILLPSAPDYLALVFTLFAKKKSKADNIS